MAKKPRKPHRASDFLTATLRAATLKGLPRRDTTWIGARVPFPVHIEGTTENVDLALWMDAATGLAMFAHTGPRGASDLMRLSLEEAMLHPLPNLPPHRPTRIAVMPPEEAAGLADLMHSLDIAHDPKADFSELNNAIGGLTTAVALTPPVSGMLAAPARLLESFCEATAQLWKHAPWRHLSDFELVGIEGLTEKPLLISLMGKLQEAYGFIIFLRPEAAAALLLEEVEDMASVPCLVVSYDPESRVGPTWPALVRREGWAIGEKDTYATVIRLGDKNKAASAADIALAVDVATILSDIPCNETLHGRLHFTFSDGRTAMASWVLTLEKAPPTAGQEPAPSAPSTKSRTKRAPSSAPSAPSARSRTKQAASTDEVYQLKIALKGSKPPIWRRVLVTASMTLQHLHEVIQSAMEWEDRHLWSFMIHGEEYGDEGINPTRTRLKSLHLGPKSSFRYVYDFGDDWEHVITVEKILPGDALVGPPVCLAGKRAGPPEDCGGIWSYNSLVAGDPQGENEESELWIEPEHFNLDDVNAELAVRFPLPPRGKKRAR